MLPYIHCWTLAHMNVTSYQNFNERMQMREREEPHTHAHNVSDGLCNCSTHRNLWAHTFQIYAYCVYVWIFFFSLSLRLSCFPLLGISVSSIIFSCTYTHSFSFHMHINTHYVHIYIDARWCIARVWMAIVSIHELFWIEKKRAMLLIQLRSML